MSHCSCLADGTKVDGNWGQGWYSWILNRPLLILQVREYEFNAELQDMQEKSTEKLKKDVEAKRGQLEQWSSTAYGEVTYD